MKIGTRTVRLETAKIHVLKKT